MFPSGAGPPVLALTTKGENRAFTIGVEMTNAADKAGLPGTFRVLDPAPAGAEVLPELPHELLAELA